jgi:hypothetical protein
MQGARARAGPRASTPCSGPRTPPAQALAGPPRPSPAAARGGLAALPRPTAAPRPARSVAMASGDGASGSELRGSAVRERGLLGGGVQPASCAAAAGRAGRPSRDAHAASPRVCSPPITQARSRSSAPGASGAPQRAAALGGRRQQQGAAVPSVAAAAARPPPRRPAAPPHRLRSTTDVVPLPPPPRAARCTEACYQQLKGVSGVVSGYAGGHVDNPSYEQARARGSDCGRARGCGCEARAGDLRLRGRARAAAWASAASAARA